MSCRINFSTYLSLKGSTNARQVKLSKTQPSLTALTSIRLSVEKNSLEAKRFLVEVQSGSVALPNMKRNIFGIEAIDHFSCILVHQFLGKSKTPVRPLHSLKPTQIDAYHNIST